MGKTIRIFCIVFILILHGCAYYPQLTDIPLISEKGDLQVDAGITTCISANTTASYGLTDKIAMQVFGNIGPFSYGLYNKKAPQTIGYIEPDCYYFQIAAGPYKKLKNGNILELYNGIGYGYGEANDEGTHTVGHLTGNYQIVFSQLNYGVTNRRFLNSDVGISLKAGYMHSKMLDKNYYWSVESPLAPLTDHIILLEPTALWRFGEKNLKFGLKAGTVLFYEFTSRNKSFPVGPLNIGMSLSYRFK